MLKNNIVWNKHDIRNISRAGIGKVKIAIHVRMRLLGITMRRLSSNVGRKLRAERAVSSSGYE